MAKGKGWAKAHSIAAAFGAAAKFVSPVALPAAGAAAGALGLRYLVSKYAPDQYAKSWVPYATGIGGALAGGAALALPFVNTKTKAAREKTYKATVPLAMLGIGVVGGVVTFGPKVWSWFKGEYPTVASALNPASGPVAQLPPPSSSTTPIDGSMLKQRMTQVRAAGLSPAQWEKLNRRAAGIRAGGLSPSGWDEIEGEGSSPRFAA